MQSEHYLRNLLFGQCINWCWLEMAIRSLMSRVLLFKIMHQIRNVLYDVKKQSEKRSSPLYEADHQRDQLRQELQKLRSLLRKKDSEIIRMHSQMDELRRKITLFEVNSKLSSQNEQESSQNQMNAFSDVPMVFEIKELKQNNQLLHGENLFLNGKGNQLQAELRQSKSDCKRLESKLKQLSILQQLREERFKDEVAKLTPIIIQESKDFVYLREGIIKVANFLREVVINIIFQIFLKCAKECQKQKKTNSFSIFKNYWMDMKASKGLGFLAVVKGYQSMKKLARTLEEQYGCASEGQYRDTMNEWILNTIIDIRHSNSAKQKEQKLFRFLGLYYRSKFPIKGQNYEIDMDIKAYFQDLICHEILGQLMSS